MSLYAQRTGLTVALQDYTDKKTGEQVLPCDLLAAFQDRGVVQTRDALHAKRTAAASIAYVLQVQGNQAALRARGLDQDGCGRAL